MNPQTIDDWKERGWLLEVSLLDAPGDIINTGGGPYYIGEAKETGYIGKSHPLIVSRYCMGMKIGRPLIRSEILKFRGDNKKDLQLSNLILHSKQATPSELLKANGVPVLGYSHCICGCGTELDLAKQKIQPYAFVEGHQPVRKEHGNLKRARPGKSKVLAEKTMGLSMRNIRAGYPSMPTTPLLGTITIPEPETEVIEEPLKVYRVLFERMIHQLPWEEFKELVQLLLEIQTREKGKE